MKLLAVCSALLYCYILVKNAWLCDDIWIGFRQVEQLFAGNGLRWNPHERIQLFTSSIGFFMTALVRYLTEDYFLNFAAQAIFFNVLVLILLARLFPSPAQWSAAVLLLAASNSYMDYTWSGLHNFVGHAMLLTFLLLWTRLTRASNEKSYSASVVIPFAVLVGLAPLFRHDFALIIWPPAAYAMWQMRRDLSFRTIVLVSLVALLPILLWTAFSLVYFGFPFPLTAYTKLGGDIPRLEWLLNGMLYYLYTISTDAPTLIIIFASLLLLVIRGGSYDRALAAGAFLHLFYTFYSGADYMGGRFFTYVYLLAVIVLVANWDQYARKYLDRGKISSSAKSTVSAWRRYLGLAPIAIAILWMLSLEHTPLKSPIYYGTPNTTKGYAGGITDERASYHHASNILSYIAFKRGEIEYYPNDRQVALGKIASRSSVPVLHICNMGMTPFNMRLDQIIIDVYGFSDVLQSRMPGLNTRPGHILRRLPQGYLTSIAENDALLADMDLNQYYAKIRLVTQSERIFSSERLKAIYAVNTEAAPINSVRRGPSRSMPLFCNVLNEPENYRNLELHIEDIDSNTLNQSGLSS